MSAWAEDSLSPGDLVDHAEALLENARANVRFAAGEVCDWSKYDLKPGATLGDDPPPEMLLVLNLRASLRNAVLHQLEAEAVYVEAKARYEAWLASLLT